VVKICAEKVRYRYPNSKIDVLKGISLEFPEGKVTALLGPNGSGKTTLLKVLLRILIPQEGNVYIDGKDINEFKRNSLSRLMAWVPQEEGSLFPYTVFEYLLMGRAPHLGFFSLPTKRDEDIITKTLNGLGAPHLSCKSVLSLSGGEKRLVLIARALAQEPEVLVLDEPTAHLDLGNKAKVLGIVRGIANLGKTVVFSTHDPNEVSLVADNVAIINGGEIVSCGIPSKIITEDILETIYGTRLMVNKVNGKPMVALASDSFKLISIHEII